ncbi:MAG: hypothetical protein ABIE23_01930 [archaeon]
MNDPNYAQGFKQGKRSLEHLCNKVDFLAQKHNNLITNRKPVKPRKGFFRRLFRIR